MCWHVKQIQPNKHIRTYHASCPNVKGWRPFELKGETESITFCIKVVSFLLFSLPLLVSLWWPPRKRFITSSFISLVSLKEIQTAMLCSFIIIMWTPSSFFTLLFSSSSYFLDELLNILYIVIPMYISDAKLFSSNLTLQMQIKYWNSKIMINMRFEVSLKECLLYSGDDQNS